VILRNGESARGGLQLAGTCKPTFPPAATKCSPAALFTSRLCRATTRY